jgi:Tol biopolymer transport system component
VWSPDGKRIAFSVSSSGAGQIPDGIWSVRRDGSDPQLLIGGGSWPDWASTGRIAFTSPNLQIWMARADGSASRRLTRRDGTAASWSPRARRIAYQRCGRCQEIPGRTELWSMKSDGSNQRRLTVGSLPSWSPDGAKIAFGRSFRSQDGPAGVFVMDANGSHVRRVPYTPRINGRRAGIDVAFPDWRPLPDARLRGTLGVPDTEP